VEEEVPAGLARNTLNTRHLALGKFNYASFTDLVCKCRAPEAVEAVPFGEEAEAANNTDPVELNEEGKQLNKFSDSGLTWRANAHRRRRRRRHEGRRRRRLILRWRRWGRPLREWHATWV
jgi:hypothetical protein